MNQLPDVHVCGASKEALKPLPFHLHLQAAVRLGQLQSKGRNPRPVNQEAFSGALDLALEMLHQSGEPLQFGDACRLLDAAAWMQVQLTEHQAAALEAAVVAGLTSGARLNSAHVRFMLSAYIRLGLQPGPELAAALAPGQCLVTAEVRRAGFNLAVLAGRWRCMLCCWGSLS